MFLCMTTNSNSSNMSQPSARIFDGNGYEHWGIMIKTLFRSYDLWNLVDKGILEEGERTSVKEDKKRDT